jgi:hypothetical protein
MTYVPLSDELEHDECQSKKNDRRRKDDERDREVLSSCGFRRRTRELDDRIPELAIRNDEAARQVGLPHVERTARHNEELVTHSNNLLRVSLQFPRDDPR